MAGLEGLASIIYHEKQQSGSMLCAQHALNSLLQGPYFTAPDLSEIARKLDLLEDQYNTESQRDGSKNMDDTGILLTDKSGFFSVQVMEEAIEVWGLNLIRWRSNAMRPYQDHPHTQLAFILNLEQHWFTLRRFGPASANVDGDPGQGHWFNLNSSLSAPEWVGKLYLGMVLQQAEAEGYSVFVVTQADPSKPLSLPRTEADDVAATLPEPRSASQSQGLQGGLKSNDIGELEGVEEEDYELQAALQASLASQEGYGSHFYEDGAITPPFIPPNLVPASSSRTYSSAASGSTSSNSSSSRSSQPLDLPGHADLDPVAASMERNRVLLQRMREQQELAHRELRSSGGFTPEQQAVQNARQQERARQEVEEAEQLRLAIAESEAMARERGKQQQARPGQDDELSVDVDANSTVDAPSFDFSSLEHRNYDDEDAELQAALRASLENVPPGWQHTQFSEPTLPSTSEAPELDKNINDKEVQDTDIDRAEEWHSESEESDIGSAGPNKAVPSVSERNAPSSLDEIRKARLARFG
ncbi:Ataxin-3 [Leucoagaricus sp. SymC.cos]|nr:Ataxin-3 [Leucoagaricus sp. SymC.cos]